MNYGDLSETVEARSKWYNIFKVLKEKINSESYIQQKYPSGRKRKSKHSQMREN